MGRNFELFDKPVVPRNKLMHVADAGGNGPDDQIVLFKCGRCGHVSEWISGLTVTQAKRGIPCPVCNS